jgi:hypothetical protein
VLLTIVVLARGCKISCVNGLSRGRSDILP